MVKIPLEAIPNQQISIVLGGQKCVLHLYQRGSYLFLDLTVDGEMLRQGAICLTDELATGFEVRGFTGMLFFVDVQQKGGIPSYDELGSRYLLIYEDEQ